MIRPSERVVASVSVWQRPLIDYFRAKGIEVHDRGRVPVEARATPLGTHTATDPGPRQPTAVQIGSGYKQQLYICPTSPEHPHTELMQ